MPAVAAGACSPWIPPRSTLVTGHAGTFRWMRRAERTALRAGGTSRARLPRRFVAVSVRVALVAQDAESQALPAVLPVTDLDRPPRCGDLWGEHIAVRVEVDLGHHQQIGHVHALAVHLPAAADPGVSALDQRQGGGKAGHHLGARCLVAFVPSEHDVPAAG